MYGILIASHSDVNLKTVPHLVQLSHKPHVSVKSTSVINNEEFSSIRKRNRKGLIESNSLVADRLQAPNKL